MQGAPSATGTQDGGAVAPDRAPTVAAMARSTTKMKPCSMSLLPLASCIVYPTSTLASSLPWVSMVSSRSALRIYRTALLLAHEQGRAVTEKRPGSREQPPFFYTRASDSFGCYTRAACICIVALHEHKSIRNQTRQIQTLNVRGPHIHF